MKKEQKKTIKHVENCNSKEAFHQMHLYGKKTKAFNI